MAAESASWWRDLVFSAKHTWDTWGHDADADAAQARTRRAAAMEYLQAHVSPLIASCPDGQHLDSPYWPHVGPSPPSEFEARTALIRADPQRATRTMMRRKPIQTRMRHIAETNCQALKLAAQSVQTQEVRGLASTPASTPAPADGDPSARGAASIADKPSDSQTLYRAYGECVWMQQEILAMLGYWHLRARPSLSEAATTRRQDHADGLNMAVPELFADPSAPSTPSVPAPTPADFASTANDWYLRTMHRIGEMF
ncbi:hypothetical protein CXG81DRAFT_16936 [Caulochytrium protostelioides]|uniref:Uncharacterized protein n=1 Tax=Caulochytrium protostelioides TaxID=1555241 RepID=A0A4P9XDK8_9FUNG|nr:hypothetical protein CXG81DRAFT_16936 [Caulochytrium protostelioides]|eukprot:RKP03558.1 hypothetical protein CXG81DRAFT_16936 [Caulochytrium protostelioides]